jgi:hypothetical protein
MESARIKVGRGQAQRTEPTEGSGEWLGDEDARVTASTHLAKRRQQSVGLALRELYFFLRT